jgi:hypothetical protein
MVTVIGAFATLVMRYGTYLPRAMFPGVSADSPVSDYVIWLWFVFLAPTYHIGTLLRIPHGSWLWGPMEILVNTFLFFLFGTVLGVVVRALKNPRR